MNINLFKMALDKLEPHHWAQFEQLASAFLSTEFPNLRTMAAPGGDGGRDSELFNTEVLPHDVGKDFWRFGPLRTGFEYLL